MSDLTFDASHYLAFVLSDESRKELIQLFPPSFEKVICHHVTIAFKLDQQTFDALIEKITPSPTVVATGFLVGKDIECFIIEINGVHRSEINGQRYHVTHSLQSPAKPVDSNKLIAAEGHEPSRKLHAELSGSLQMVRR